MAPTSTHARATTRWDDVSLSHCHLSIRRGLPCSLLTWFDSPQTVSEIIATSDDFGTVKLFRYPSIVPYADNKPYGGHSSHVTNVGFDESDKWLVSTGGEDRAVFQWELITE